MLISYCVPNFKRDEDLARSWPTAQAAADASPPVELVLVDYAKVRNYFHMAHARNLSIRMATGDYVMIGSADFLLAPELFASLRMTIGDTQATWYQPSRYLGAIVCRREALIAAGGYDERFEFYGPEDKELAMRLTRRYGAPRIYDGELLAVIPTPDALKVRGYRLPLTKREMHDRGVPVLKESEQYSTLVANKGLGWGH